MEPQVYKFALYFPEPKTQAVYDAKVLPNLVSTLMKLDMSDAESFAEKADEFKDKLLEVFKKTFSDAKSITLGAQYHPPVEDVNHRYDIGLRLDDSDDRTYCVRIELLANVKQSTTVH